jgi:hypothetical protein
LLSFIQLHLLGGQDLLLLSQNLGVVLIFYRCSSFGSRSTLSLSLTTLAHSDVLGALAIPNSQLLTLILKVELLSLTCGAFGRLRMVV